MTMSDVKLVKVDNWGIYFLQRLKHFFNRTDYCDLTLQFQDNAQLKVHRLVLSACTEYFELLERTCEMYEDCLVMPDDLQADVVVPIVNFMYTGQLEFKTDLLDRLCQTSEVMNMPVLTKLLNSHRPKQHLKKPHQSYPIKHAVASKEKEIVPKLRENPTIITKGEPLTNKRSYSKAFLGEKSIVYKDTKQNEASKKPEAVTSKNIIYKPPSPVPFERNELLDRKKYMAKKPVLVDPRPTRYELPEELDTDNVFENSFSSISYTSQPLMVHPDTQRKYSKKPRQLGESSSKKYIPSGTSTMDIVECKKVSKDQIDSIFEDTVTDRISLDPMGVDDMFQPFVKVEQPTKDSSQLFDQILEQSEDVAKVSLETANNKKTIVANLDHAKIISEVLKKYPHLVKSNKNIKLKILNTPSKNAKKQKSQPEKPVVFKTEPMDQDYTYEADVLDSKQAARLIALGAENIEGPWICLICGTPGRALQFTTYYKYRRHLVEVHNEKPVLTICEYCGHKLNKRNYLLHHMYTKHGIEPPPQYHFPKCTYPQCDYIALSETILAKHKMSHGEGKNYRNYVALTEAVVKSRIAAERNRSFQCHVCLTSFKNSNQLLAHIQATDHKFKKPNLQCIYCNKTFLRESNLYSHLKIHHKAEITRDNVMEDSDDESQPQNKVEKHVVREIKCETPVNDYEEVDIQYQIQQRPDGIHVVTKKQNDSSQQNIKHKILNSGFSTSVEVQQKPKTPTLHNEFMQPTNISNETETANEIIMIDNTEYIMKGNKLTRTNRKLKEPTGEFILPDMVSLKSNLAQNVETVALPLEYSNISNSTSIQENIETNEINSNMGQPISIYVSNEEEYKALMSANHPIIFDADDTNKSLTVLTTPHGETLETTTIDLDNTQSNEMMVIQDGFPLNVSQAISTENQNIVVVYSNQVDQDKGYQLISTQLDPQFVNSSAIITQNFETITTSTPVMSAHVLGTQIDENWQTNTIHQHIDDKPIDNSAETVIQQTIPCSEVEMTNSMEQNIEMVGLPEVELTHDKVDVPQTTVNENVTSQVLEEQHTEQVETTEQVITENLSTENLSFMPVDEVIPTEEIVEGTINTENPSDIAPPETNITDEEPSINEAVLQTEVEEIIEQDVSTQNMETDNVQSQTYTPEPEENIDENIQQPSEFIEETIASEPIIEHDQSQTETSEENIQPVDVPTANVTDEATVEKIQSLASEWSEEDSETTSQDITIDTTNKEVPETAPEVEESIENIQQEVLQFSEAKSVPIIAGNNITTEIVEERDKVVTEDNTEVDESNAEEHKTDSTEEPVIEVPTTKITSLLNDWEDNDSQDEGTDENKPTENEPAEVTTDAPTELEKPVEVAIPAPQDKIKSLVSDWDEEEEENK